MLKLDPDTPEFRESMKKIQKLTEHVRAGVEKGEDVSAPSQELVKLRAQTGIAEEIGGEYPYDDD